MSVDRRTAAYLPLADEELRAARMLASGAPRQAAYYVQQSAEKAARALLTAAGIPFGTGHNLAGSIGIQARQRYIDTLPRSVDWRRRRMSPW